MVEGVAGRRLPGWSELPQQIVEVTLAHLCRTWPHPDHVEGVPARRAEGGACGELALLPVATD